MGKKGVKSKKTKWLTISLSENPLADKNECPLTISPATRKPTTAAALLANTSLQTASSTTSSIISSSSATTDTLSATEKCTSPNSYHHPSNYYRSYNNYHHSNTNNNSSHNSSHNAPNNYNSAAYNSSHNDPPGNNGHYDSKSEDRNSSYGSYNGGNYRRRPFRGSGASFGSRRLPRNYTYSNRMYDQHTNDSEKGEQITTTTKTSKFNEDEYTRITTPRQDVLFKKGYLSRPKKCQPTDNLDGTEGSSTPVSSECGYKSMDSPDIDYASMYSPGYVDENGVFIVNPLYMDGYNFYNGAMMMYSPSSNGQCQSHRAMNPMNFYNNIQYMPVDFTDKCIDESTETLPSHDEMDTKDSDSTEENSTKETVKTEHNDTANDEVETNGDLNGQTTSELAVDEDAEAIDEGVDETMHQSNGVECSYGYYDLPPNMYPPPFYYPGYVFGQVPYVPMSGINFNDLYDGIENAVDEEYEIENQTKMNGNKVDAKDALDSSGVTSTDFSGDDSSDCSFGHDVKRSSDLSNGNTEFVTPNLTTTTTVSTVPKIVSNLNVEVQEFHPRYLVSVPKDNVITDLRRPNGIQERRNKTVNNDYSFKKFSSNKQQQHQNVQKTSLSVVNTMNPTPASVVEPAPKIEASVKKSAKKIPATISKKNLIESTKMIEEQNIDLTKKTVCQTQKTDSWNFVGTKGKRKRITENMFDQVEREKSVSKSPEKSRALKFEKLVEETPHSQPEPEPEVKPEIEKKPAKLENPVDENSTETQITTAAKNKKSKPKNKKKTAKRTLILNNMDTFTVIEPDFIVKKFNIKEHFAKVADADDDIDLTEADDIQLQLALEETEEKLEKKKVEADQNKVDNIVDDYLPSTEEIILELEKCNEDNEVVNESTDTQPIEEEEKEQDYESEIVENWADEVEADCKVRGLDVICAEVEIKKSSDNASKETLPEESNEDFIENRKVEVVEQIFMKDNCSFLANEQLPTIDESVETESFETENAEVEVFEEQIVDLIAVESQTVCIDIAIEKEDETADVVSEVSAETVDTTVQQLKFPITEAVSKWLTEARKDNITKPLFVIPENTKIMGKIKNSISDWLYESYQNDNYDDIDILTDSEIDDDNDDNNEENNKSGQVNDNYVLNNRALKNAADAFDATVDSQENDTDSDYMSDIQVKNGDGKNSDSPSNRNSFDDDNTGFGDGHQPNSNNYKETFTSDSTLKSTKNAKKLHSCLIM